MGSSFTGKNLLISITYCFKINLVIRKTAHSQLSGPVYTTLRETGCMVNHDCVQQKIILNFVGRVQRNFFMSLEAKFCTYSREAYAPGQKKRAKRLQVVSRISFHAFAFWPFQGWFSQGGTFPVEQACLHNIA